MHSAVLIEALIVVLAAGTALFFRPFQVLRESALQVPWLAALVVLPLLWSGGPTLPGGITVLLSGACLLVLMFGWPLAVWTLLPVALLAGWIDGRSWQHVLELAAWHGVLPATLGLAVGVATRRWLPAHPFVYILARGFLGTAIATMLAGVAAALLQPPPPGITLGGLLVGRWLMAWGDAVLTGMLVAIFVAFKPQWLLTWSDTRYLPRG